MAAAAALGLLLALAPAAEPARGAAPAGTEVTLTVDATQGHRPISPYLFGLNAASSTSANFARRSAPQGPCAGHEQWGAVAIPSSRVGSTRMGANRSPWNWENDLSSSGVDLEPPSLDLWSSRSYLCTPHAGQPGGAARGIVEDAIRDGIPAAVVTMPMIGWVPRAMGRPATPLAADARTPATTLDPSLWVPERAARTPGVDRAVPRPNGQVSYQEDLVKWLDARFGPGNAGDGTDHWSKGPGRIILQLDNEPDLWGNNTHHEIRGAVAGKRCGRAGSDGCVVTGYDELVERTVEHALAAKVVAPRALVMGGGWGTFVGLVKGAPGNRTSIREWARERGDPAWQQYDYYVQYFLRRLREAEGRWSEALGGGRLVDILDYHPYVQAHDLGLSGGNAVRQSEVIANERIDVARSFWDPGYVDADQGGRGHTWVVKSIPDCPGGQAPCALQLIPRMRRWISEAGFPTWPEDPQGMKVAFTEWSLYRQGDVSNAVGVADVLGVFAREGVYLANYWLMGGEYDTSDYECHGPEHPAQPSCRYNKAQVCLHAAFKAWRDFDGQGGRHGDTYVLSSSSDPVRASVYGTADSADPRRLVVVALNRRAAPLRAGLAVTAPVAYGAARWWQVTGGNGAAAGCQGPVRRPDLAASGPNAFTATLPPYSINVFEFTR